MSREAFFRDCQMRRYSPAAGAACALLLTTEPPTDIKLSATTAEAGPELLERSS